MTDYYGGGWQKILAANNLESFDALWELKTEWFEAPNIRRGGWSGVIKLDLDTPEGKVGVFIKRQENHLTKTLFNPIKGRPTFEREFQNLLRLKEHKVPTLEPVYFSARNHNGELQAILITKELAGYLPLDSERFLENSGLIRDAAHKNRLLQAIGDTLRKMHLHHFQHNCLYLKHIFVRPVGNDWDVKVIDLEKLKKTIFKRSAVIRDLYTLHRHTTGWSARDQVVLFKSYRQETKLSKTSKNLWKTIEKKILSKRG
ncbi:MAG: lipopolysaccharide kinase [Methylophaga sp.]|nr:lipopolysaccharide kinase [Methylophaga sp.]